MAEEEKTGETLSQDDIDKLLGGEGSSGAVDQEKLAEEWAQSLESGKPMAEEGSPDRGARKASFAELDEPRPSSGQAKDLDFILDIPLEVTVEMGRTRMLINDLLQVGQGSVIELNRLAGEPLDILINGKLIARGEVVVVSEKFGIRITDIVSPLERVKRLS
ncbi:MAG TPA: flagellar motor switch protein FliN [Deltaproteobacteria bacterium]|nr:flagellar motor switch protein FliN [Deltaproteobacteria bacterium]HOM30113.1 flagellar motor switch protein FliN [Deltaproteobacteria bacterium]HPP79866.1 flagellar motor switch protein FliN [Deltaproteobacteria bacterium]